MNTTPDFNALPPFYKNYVMYVHEDTLLHALENSIKQTINVLTEIPESMGEYRYAPNKWSIKELLCHIMDAERIFAYRALRFARNDATPLAAFEENDYAPEANAHGRTLNQLSNEMSALRKTTLDLFASFTPEMLQRKGTASNKIIAVVNLGYVIAGHETHHRLILTDRYLKK